MKFYPLGDRLTRVEAKALGLDPKDIRNPLPSIGGDCFALGEERLTIQAVSAGVMRPPKAGERYLSGSRIVAYQAPNDLSTSYHIAKLVVTRKVTTERIVIVG